MRGEKPAGEILTSRHESGRIRDRRDPVDDLWSCPSRSERLSGRKYRGAYASGRRESKNCGGAKRPAPARQGQGVPAHGRESVGDLYLHLMVRVPKDETPQDVIEKIDRAHGENVRKDLHL